MTKQKKSNEMIVLSMLFLPQRKDYKYENFKKGIQIMANFQKT